MALVEKQLLREKALERGPRSDEGLKGAERTCAVLAFGAGKGDVRPKGPGFTHETAARRCRADALLEAKQAPA